MKTKTKYSILFFPILPAVPLFSNNHLLGDDVKFNSDDDKLRAFEDIEDKIVGGKTTTAREHPYHVRITWPKDWGCIGALISATRALTTARCLLRAGNASRCKIMAGSTLLIGDANAQYRTPSSFLSHPKYNARYVPNDIGLVYWEQPLNFSATVRAIALLPQGMPVRPGVNCTLTGWGRTSENGPPADRLMAVTIPIISDEECKRVWRGHITADMLCAGTPEGGRGFCYGDTGGPLVLNNVLVGIASWTYGCARARVPEVYARVPFFTSWIRDNM